MKTKGMARGVAGLGVAVAMAAALAMPVDAQQGPRGRGQGMGPGERAGMGMGMRGDPSGLPGRIQAALEHREALGLDEAQVQKLQELQGAAEGAHGAVQEELDRLREEMRTNVEGRAALRERFLEVRNGAQQAHQPLRDSFLDILTAEQQRELGTLLRPERGRGGMGAARPGRGGGAAMGPFERGVVVGRMLQGRRNAGAGCVPRGPRGRTGRL